MKIAIIVTGVGHPRALSSTSYVGTLAEAFAAALVPTRVVGLAKQRSEWLPESLGCCDATAPLLPKAPPTGVDRLAVARRILRSRWFDELRLYRDLKAFAAGERDGVVMVYPRSDVTLQMGHRIATRLGWKTMVFATEALTDNKIDPAMRDDYVRHVRDYGAGVWAVSTDIANRWIKDGVPPERIHISHTAVRMDFFSTESSPARSAHAVYLGNLVREMDYLLEIAELVRARVPGFHITVYGDAPDADRVALIQEIAARGLSQTVTIESAVAPVNVPGVLKHADVLLLPRALKGPYPAEGFPKKLGEYLASGRPTVVTAVRDIPTYVTDGVEAFVVPPDDMQAFADAVVRALADSGSAEKIGARGREVAIDLFGAEKVAERAIAFMQRL